MIAALLATVIAADSPNVAIVQRSVIDVPPATLSAIMREVEGRLASAGLKATVAPPCPRSVDCLTATAAKDGVAAAVGVSVASGLRGLSVDLEAKKHTGDTQGTWTGTLPARGLRLPPDAEPFFASLAEALIAPTRPAAPLVVDLAPAPATARAAKSLFISSGVAAVVAGALGIAGVVVRGPLDAKLQMAPVITGITRDGANQQVTAVNALFSASLGLALVALGLGISAAIALLVD